MNHYPLRRADRALARKDALAVLDAAPFIVVSTVDDDGMPYGVPVSFVRSSDTLYFHAAREGGHKTEDFRRDARVCATCVVDVHPFYEEGDFTTSYRSVVARGRVREVEDAGEFRRALADLCMKYVPAAKHGIGLAMKLSGGRTAVWAIDVEELSGKARPQQGPPIGGVGGAAAGGVGGGAAPAAGGGTAVGPDPAPGGPGAARKASKPA